MVPVINKNAEAIKERMSYYKFTVKLRVMTTNHLESLLAKDGDTHVVKSVKKEIEHLRKREQEIILEVKTIINRDAELQIGYKNIISIVGIGEISAIVLLHLFIKYPDANKKQLTSLVGLDVKLFESGKSILKKPKISKEGSKLYRSTLFMGAITASMHKNSDLKIFFDRLKENGKHTTVAHIAVMRKLVVIAHSLFKTKQSYNSEFYKKHCGIKMNS